MHIAAAVSGCFIVILVLVDAFNTIVRARRTDAVFRITRAFYWLTWKPWAALAAKIQSGRKREHYLGIYGPLALILLLGCWAAMLIFGFGLLHWAAQLRVARLPVGLAGDLYFSGAALFTVGSNPPQNSISKFLLVAESGLGIGFLGMVVGYLPVFYQSFAARERRISLLDARAGSPPSGSELLRRMACDAEHLEGQLADWEEWEAEFLETHLSYPMLGYFRSHHQNQSWLGALTAILDASAIVILCSTGELKRQAELVFAMGRHAVADLAHAFNTPPQPIENGRLKGDDLECMRTVLESRRTALAIDRLAGEELGKLVAMYEPYANALSLHFLMALPGWLPDRARPDNWQITAWERSSSAFAVSDPFEEGRR